MAKTKGATKSEQLAVALFQEHLSKEGVQFPRPPATWAKAEPRKPAQGLLEEAKHFADRLAEYEAALGRAETDFNPEVFYVMGYLAGTVREDDRGRHKKEYFGPFTEGIGRLLLAELLKSEVEIPRAVRTELARLISPSRDGTQQSEREFTIQFRSKGKRPDYIKELQICEEIAQGLNAGQLVKQAISHAMEKHQLSRSAVLSVWEKNRDAFVRLGWLTTAKRTKSKLKRQ